eukprot:TRINITY_DN49958_c0_g1_i1.p2 TRINITY_DN49958_c0_g1~~TRINITY_DN49958_c0_g1_i1.p2  ORF type:complete len:262 (-),score=40.45 TRINITY_DN49958_c0_g1_i1:350-1135(-)
MSFSNNDVQICDSAVDKLRLAMSPSGKIQQTNLTNLNNKKNCSMLGGNVDNFERGYNASMLGGSNLSLPTLLATLNATSKNNVQDSGESATTKKGSIKTGLLLESDDSPRSVFGLHPELLPKIDNINILFGTTNQDSTLKKPPTLSKGTDHLRSTEYVCQREKQLYKTELCMLWVEKGFCEFGSQCKFAHTEEERRNVQKHPKFKTKMCRHFVETGTCPFGRRCHFLHGHESPQKPPVAKPQCQAIPNAGRLPIFQTLSSE